MKFNEFLKNNIVILDGGMGTLLQENGLLPGELPERWNLTRPEVIEKIHTEYYDAGSNVVLANTFGANSLKFEEKELESVISAGVAIAKRARAKSKSEKAKFVALDIGPTGKLLKPYGDLDFEDAVSVFKRTVELGVKVGVDLVYIETMNDSLETKAALLAARETTDLPVIVTNAYSEDGKLMTGASPEVMALMLEGLGATAVGANCSLGPKELRAVCEKLIEYSSLPIVLKPNAGLPRVSDKGTVYDITKDEFVTEVKSLVKLGVRAVGGCCGTTPEYILALSESLNGFTPPPIEKKTISAVTSSTHAVEFGKRPILIGERINPTGKKRFKEALLADDMDYILNEAVKQEEAGCDILDVNVGLPEIDEAKTLKRAVCEIQSVVNLPLQIDTADAIAMEGALRAYNGKPLINSVNGKEESMRQIFPLVKKYGGSVIALTLDEKGIPPTAEGRVEIARKILKTAAEYGIEKHNIVFDTLTMTVSTDKSAAKTTLTALKRIKEEFGVDTSLGVSNVSFGLPSRDAVNSAFFLMALESGLSMAIMNPYSSDMMKAYHSYLLLSGFDENAKDFIKASEAFDLQKEVLTKPMLQKEEDFSSELRKCIVKGFKDKAFRITKELLLTKEPLEIINEEIIPALNEVGEGYEKGRVYLPELLISAESAKSAFEAIKLLASKESGEKKKATVVIATVKGDIHDIGKNIVKLLFENYGFNVIDLGKDTPPSSVLEAATDNNADFVVLSALMTTTLPSMKESVRLIRENLPKVKTIVGGAVLTEDYAKMIGADKYARDAMEAVRYAEENI